MVIALAEAEQLLPLKQCLLPLASQKPSLFFSILCPRHSYCNDHAFLELPLHFRSRLPEKASFLLIMGSVSGSYSLSEAGSLCGFSLFSVDSDSQKPDLDGCDVKPMVERFAKLLLGEDFSGGRKGVSTALAISNAIINLSATVFGQLWKLEPLAAEKKMMWYREMDWLLCVSDSIVELIPSIQESPDGGKIEVMASRPRSDVYVNLPALKKLDVMLIGILDEFGNSDFFYVSCGADDDGNESSSSERPSNRLEKKWWLPFPKVPSDGLSATARKRLQRCRDCVNQMHKAASAINSSVLAEMEIPYAYLDDLPKSAKTCLGEVIYRNMISNDFCPHLFLDCYLEQLSEHATLEIANRVETAIHIWRKKFRKSLVHAKSSWSGKVKGLVHDSDTDKFKRIAQRAESLLDNLRIRFPDLPQTDLDRSKVQHNKDVGKSILESYSRVMKSLSLNIMALIDEIIYVDDATKKRAAAHHDMGSGFDLRFTTPANIT